MNLVDIIIIIIALPLLLSIRHNFLYHAANAFLVFSGYLLGFYIVVNNVGNMRSPSEIGNALLFWTLGLALLGRILSFVVRLTFKLFNKKAVNTSQEQNQSQVPSKYAPSHKNTRISDRLHMETAVPPTEELFKKKRQKLVHSILGVPYKLVRVLIAVFLLSQTLIYTPILWVQFSTQGSAFILAATRFLPDTEISKAAKNLYPHEFERIELTFDHGPIKSTAKTENNNFKNAVNKVSPSVVRIAVSQCGGTRLGSGSGVVIAHNLVITNEHVATGASELFIVDHRGTYPAAVIIIDDDYDIAVIYSKYINLKPVAVSNEPFISGEDAMTMGYPGGSADLHMAIGKTSTTKIRSIHNKLDSSSSFELSAMLGPGSSGGPVINSDGKIIGINSGGNDNLLLAVRAEQIARLINTAKSKLIPSINIGCQYQRKSY